MRCADSIHKLVEAFTSSFLADISKTVTSTCFAKYHHCPLVFHTRLKKDNTHWLIICYILGFIVNSDLEGARYYTGPDFTGPSNGSGSSVIMWVLKQGENYLDPAMRR